MHKQKTLCVLVIVSLFLLITSCGKGSINQTDMLKGQSPPTSTLDVQTEAASASNVVAAEIGASVEKGDRVIPDFSFEKKSLQIVGTFSKEAVSRNSPHEMKEGKRAAGEFLVFYYDDRTLDSINANREIIKQTGNTNIALFNEMEVSSSGIALDSIDAGLSSLTPEIGETMGSPSMMTNPDYVAVTRYLAQTYGLEVQMERYVRNSNWVKFTFDETRDNAQLALKIQKENNDIIKIIEPNRYQTSYSHYPRVKNNMLDDVQNIGVGIVPINSRRSDWNGDESYYYFGTKAHFANSSFSCNTGLSANGFVYNREIDFDRFPNSHDYNPNPRAFVVDSGFEPGHPDMLAGRRVIRPLGINPGDPGYSTYWDPYGSDPGMVDYNPGPGHGTPVAGVICASEDNLSVNEQDGGLGTAGVGSYTTVFPFAGDDDASLVEGIERAFDVRNIYNCYVVNISWGGYFIDETIPEALKDIMEYIRADPRFLIVAAAGNGNGVVNVLDDWDPVTEVTTGYLPSSFAYPYFSWLGQNGYYFYPSEQFMNVGGHNYGWSAQENDLFPGSLTVWSHAGFKMACDPGYNGGFYSGSGTSFAAPTVTAMVATLQHYAPELSALDIKRHIAGEPVFNPGLGVMTRRFGSARTKRFDNQDHSKTGVLKPPIADFGNAMPWIDIESPDQDAPWFPTKQVDGGEITLVARVHLPPRTAEDPYPGSWPPARDLEEDYENVSVEFILEGVDPGNPGGLGGTPSNVGLFHSLGIDDDWSELDADPEFADVPYNSDPNNPSYGYHGNMKVYEFKITINTGDTQFYIRPDYDASEYDPGSGITEREFQDPTGIRNLIEGGECLLHAWLDTGNGNHQKLFARPVRIDIGNVNRIYGNLWEVMPPLSGLPVDPTLGHLPGQQITLDTPQGPFVTTTTHDDNGYLGNQGGYYCFYVPLVVGPSVNYSLTPYYIPGNWTVYSPAVTPVSMDEFWDNERVDMYGMSFSIDWTNDYVGGMVYKSRNPDVPAPGTPLTMSCDYWGRQWVVPSTTLFDGTFYLPLFPIGEHTFSPDIPTIPLERMVTNGMPSPGDPRFPEPDEPMPSGYWFESLL